MVSKTTPGSTDGNKEPLIYSTRMLSFIAADQAVATELTIDVKLRHNSKCLVRNEQLNTLPLRGSSLETGFVDQCRQGELKNLFLCPGDYPFGVLKQGMYTYHNGLLFATQGILSKGN